MKCVTICQPWAWAIVSAPEPFRKLTENRTWYCGHRGPLLIHAGKSRKWLVDPVDWHEWYGFSCPNEADLTFGAIVGVVDMIGCVRPIDPSVRGHMYAERPWCHVYANAEQFSDLIPYRGAQQLFDVPNEVVTDAIEELAIRSQRGGAR